MKKETGQLSVPLNQVNGGVRDGEVWILVVAGEVFAKGNQHMGDRLVSDF